ILDALPRTNCTSLETRAETCRGALRTVTRSASNPCFAKIPSSLASQRGVPAAATPEYATLMDSALTGQANRTRARTTQSVLASISILREIAEREFLSRKRRHPSSASQKIINEA